MKLEIYYGAVKPIKAIGRNQCRLLSFAEKYRCWHSFKNDKATKRAIESLKRKDCLEVIGDQFRFKYPSSEVQS